MLVFVKTFILKKYAMRKSIILSFVLAASLLLPVSLTGQSLKKETRNLSGFSSVSFGVAGDLYINLGKEFKVTLEGDADILRNIETEVNSGKLVIKKDNWNFNFNEKVTVNVTLPELKGLSVSGSGKAEILDKVSGVDLDFSVSGSGRIVSSELDVENLECSISGSGNIITDRGGVVKDGEISISGSGNYQGEALEFKTLEVSISGSGNCSCYVTESLEARVSGSGNVNYKGNPKIDARVSGSGKVRSR